MYKHFRIVSHVSCNILSRTRHITHFECTMKQNAHYSKVKNPGLNRRLKGLELKETDALDDPDIIDMESDFMNMGDMYDAHKSELQNLKEQQQLRSIERKYFKGTKDPTLLTWEEREQIHYLHNSDPQEWDANKLACSFPASESTIKKIIKAQWKPLNAEKKLKYNEKVQKNWKLLRQGKLEIASDLKAHVEQFASRTHVSSNPGIPEVSSSKRQNHPSEFENIIQSYKALNSKGTDSDLQNTTFESESKFNISGADTDDTFILKSNANKRAHRIPLTLEKYRESVLNSIENSDIPNKKENIMLVNNIGKKVIQPEKVNSLKINVLVPEDKKMDYSKESAPQYPEKIKIPKDEWIQGRTYKVDDCYYDDDGEFLYRVPGIKI